MKEYIEREAALACVCIETIPAADVEEAEAG